jgi:hypothetical protein
LHKNLDNSISVERVSLDGSLKDDHLPQNSTSGSRISENRMKLSKSSQQQRTFRDRRNGRQKLIGIVEEREKMYQKVDNSERSERAERDSGAKCGRVRAAKTLAAETDPRCHFGTVVRNV